MVKLFTDSGMDSAFTGMDPEQMGMPDEDITNVADVSEYVDLKLDLLSRHATQIAPDSPFARLPADVTRRMRGTEHFQARRRRALPRGRRPERPARRPALEAASKRAPAAVWPRALALSRPGLVDIQLSTDPEAANASAQAGLQNCLWKMPRRERCRAHPAQMRRPHAAQGTICAGACRRPQISQNWRPAGLSPTTQTPAPGAP